MADVFAAIGYEHWVIHVLLGLPILAIPLILFAPVKAARYIAFGVALTELGVGIGLWWADEPGKSVRQVVTGNDWVAGLGRWSGGQPRSWLVSYGMIAVVDGVCLQPYIMKCAAKVPIWASILTRLVLGFIIPFWGVLLAPPLLAVLFAYRWRTNAQKTP